MDGAGKSGAELGRARDRPCRLFARAGIEEGAAEFGRSVAAATAVADEDALHAGADQGQGLFQRSKHRAALEADVAGGMACGNDETHEEHLEQRNSVTTGSADR